jgi:excisionase family DNA binding protein
VIPAQEERVSEDRLSPREAAAYIEREWHLRVHPETVRRWVAKEAVRATRTSGGRILIDPADLHAVFDGPSEADGND